ncbi:MAG: hypothetical protein FWC40_02510 [Proteobacteria bacterium]|nr:hypothetical protein [Pseudomonadota bacterium]
MQASEQISFSEVQRLSRIALEAGDLVKLQGILVPLLREDDRSRSAGDNLFIYRTLGAMYRDQDKDSESLMAFEQAYGYDPRHFEVLETLAEAELRKEASEANVKLLMELLVFHRESLKSPTIFRIFRLFGDHRQAMGNLDEAREYYEKALEARPGDMELIHALLKVSQASGNDEAIVKSREKLLSTLTSPESRAAVLVSIGDDYLNAFQDEARALATYEEALSECAQSTAALQRILIIAERAEDWGRTLNALEALVNSTDDSEEKAKYLLKMAWIFKEKLDNTKHAIQLFNEVLDLQPEQLEVFQGLIGILTGQEDYLSVEANYELMIERQRKISPLNVKLLAVLCKNLGELRLKHLNNIPGAAQAYQVVSELYPDNPNFHAVLAKLYAQSEDTLSRAIFENREVLRLAPDRVECVGAMARCYRRLEKYDESLCTYRVLDVLGLNDDDGRAIVERFKSSTTPRISSHFTEDDWRLLRPATLDNTIAQILRISVPAIGNCFANDFDHYRIREQDARVNMSDPTVFVGALKQAIQPLGFAEVPNVYRCDQFKGVVNAFFSQRSFLVNPDYLSGRAERDIVFTTSKALLLMRPEFYLLQLGREALELIFYTIFKTAVPQLNITLDKQQLKVSKALERNLSSADMNSLADKVRQLNDRGANLNLRLFLESVEDFANRVGLLFCDDPSIIERLLKEESRVISSRSPQERLGSLLVWAMSEEYMALRKRLDISIRV